MTNKRFTQNMSKTEEIEAIEGLYAQVAGLGLYVTDLFTPGFVAWVSEQIKNDFPPDLYQWYTGAKQDRDNALAKAQNDLANAKREIASAESAITALQDKAKSDGEKINNLAIAYNNANDDITNLRYQMNDAESTIENLQSTVLRLKAHIYDLEHGAS